MKKLYYLLAVIFLGMLPLTATAQKESDRLTAQDLFEVKQEPEYNMVNCLIRSPKEIKAVMKRLHARSVEAPWEVEEFDDFDEYDNERFIVYEATMAVYILKDEKVTFVYYENPDDPSEDFQGLSIDFRTLEARNAFLESALDMGFSKVEGDDFPDLYGWGPGVGYYIQVNDYTLLFYLNVG